jgi:DNA adenine methylase
MKYMGSKRRIAKYILPIILKNRRLHQTYVEPFVGGANVIDKVDGVRIGADNNKYLISLFKKLQKGWTPPSDVTEELFNDVKSNLDKYPDYLCGYLGFGFSFGSMWFQGFVGRYKDKGNPGRDRIGESYRNIIKTKESISGINFQCCEYRDLKIPAYSLIYCDPPYFNTTGYGTDCFDNKRFWEWCREKAKEGHQIFISEYQAPDDFECVWEKELQTTITAKSEYKKSVEKLFTLNL